MALSVTTCSPSNGQQGQTVRLAIIGTEFDPDAAPVLRKSGQTDITGTNVVVESTTLLKADFALTLVTALGQWNVRVVNVGTGSFAVRNNIFTVLVPAGVFMSIHVARRFLLARSEEEFWREFIDGVVVEGG